MLAEGFLRVLPYREEKRFASPSKQKRSNSQQTDQLDCFPPDSDQPDSAETGLIQAELEPGQVQGQRAGPEGPLGLLIPRSAPGLIQDPEFVLNLDDCSLLDQYPDLQVADSGRITQNPRATNPQPGLYSPVYEACRPQGEPLVSIPDQGYLVMGPSEDLDLDLPGSGLEPMSNSVLNGLLEKQLEEVYMQHLTENLARCNSDLGNSLLHGLVPPPQPSSSSQPYSLEASLDPESSSRKISYLSTQNPAPCSSNFSSPVLRISEAENAPQHYVNKY